jgi:O-antigen/teichoic acid export membrane protein
MSEANKTLKFAAIYSIGVFLNKIVSIVMLPIYTRNLSPKDYGTIELLTMTTDIFGLFVGFGITTAMFRYYYRYDTQKERNTVISTLAILLILLALFASSLGILASGPLAEEILEGGRTDSIYFQLMFVILFLQVFIEIPLTFIRSQQRPYLFVLINAGKLIIQLSLNIYFIVILEMHVIGVLYSALISFSIIGGGLIIYTFKNVGFAFNNKLAKSVIIFGAPFIITNLCEFILTFSDRYFLKSYAGIATVGIYSLGYKLGFVLWAFAVAPFYSMWETQRFAIVKDENIQEINSVVFLSFNILLISCALGISLFSLDLFRIMSAKEFWPAYKIVPIVMLAYIFQGWTIFCNFGILYKGKTGLIALGTFLAAIVVILMSFLLIPTYTIYGAAIATALAFFIRFLFIYIKSQKLYYILLPWRKVNSILLIAVVIMTVSLSLQSETILWSILIKSAFFSLYIGIIFIAPILTINQKKTIYNMLVHPLRKKFSLGSDSGE